MRESQGAQDLGKAVLRIVLGILILLHGIAKISTGTGFVGQMLDQVGLPAALAYLVYIGEILAPVLLIVGLWTRLAAAIIAVNMLFAIGLVHMKQIGLLNNNGGWELELQGMFLGAAIALMLLGAGRISLGGVHGKLN